MTVPPARPARSRRRALVLATMFVPVAGLAGVAGWHVFAPQAMQAAQAQPAAPASVPAIVSAVAEAPPPPDVPEPGGALAVLLQQAKYWRAQQQLDRAIVSLNRALLIAPDNREALTLLAEAQAAKGDSVAAEAVRARLPKPAPAVTAAASTGDSLAEARRLAAAGDAEGAVAAYDRVLNGHPPPDALAVEYNLALAATPGGFDSARTALSVLVLRFPQDERLQLGYARLLIDHAATRLEGIARLSALAQNPAMTDEATQAWRTALAQLPDSKEFEPPLSEYVTGHPADGEMAAKLAALRGAAPAQTAAAKPPAPVPPPAAAQPEAPEPNAAAVALDLARALARDGRMDEARATIDEALGPSPSVAALKAAISFASETGDAAAAAALIARLPAAARTADMLALQRQADLQRQIAAAAALPRAEARQRLLALAAAPDRDGTRGAAIARALARLGDPAMPRAAVIAAAAATPGQGAAAKLRYAEALLDAGDTAAASEMLAGVDPAAGLSAAQRQTLARLQTALAAKPDDAQAVASQPADAGAQAALLQRDPGNLEARHAAIAAALQSGDRAAAQSLVSGGLALAPTDPVLWLQSAQLAQVEGDTPRALHDLRQARELRLQQLGAAGPAALAAPHVATAGETAASDADPDQPPVHPLLDTSATELVPPLAAPAADLAHAGPPPGMDAMPPRGGFRLAAAGDDEGALAAHDPLTQQIDRSIAALQDRDVPSVQTAVAFASQTGPGRLNRLDDITVPVEANFSPGGFGPITVTATPTFLQGGTEAGAAARRDFGSLALAHPGSLAMPRQTAEGAALDVGFRDGDLSADLGATPLGFRAENVAGGVEWAPRLTDALRLRLDGERRAVTDSVLSYAGATDPRTGAHWGGVTRDRARASLEYEFGRALLYASGGFSELTGSGVHDNAEWEAGVGGSLELLHTDSQDLRAGLDLTYFGYQNNLRYFSLGQGGYFSPQSFVSALVPVTYKQHLDDALSYELGAAAGMQSYRERATPFFPLNAALQGQLAAQQSNPATAIAGVLTQYPGHSQSGFAGDAHLSADYRLSDSLHLGARVEYRHLEDYDITSGMLFARYLFGGE